MAAHRVLLRNSVDVGGRVLDRPLHPAEEPDGSRPDVLDILRRGPAVLLVLPREGPSGAPPSGRGLFRCLSFPFTLTHISKCFCRGFDDDDDEDDDDEEGDCGGQSLVVGQED